MCLVVTCWERADLLALVCPTVSLSLSHWYPGSGVVLDSILKDFENASPRLNRLFHKAR